METARALAMPAFLFDSVPSNSLFLKPFCSPSNQAFKLRLDLAVRKLGRALLGAKDQVKTRGLFRLVLFRGHRMKPMLVQPEVLPYPALEPVPLMGLAGFSTYNQAQPWSADPTSIKYQKKMRSMNPLSMLADFPVFAGLAHPLGAVKTVVGHEVISGRGAPEQRCVFVLSGASS